MPNSNADKLVIRVNRGQYGWSAISYWNSEIEKLVALPFATRYDTYEQACDATCELQCLPFNCYYKNEIVAPSDDASYCKLKDEDDLWVNQSSKTLRNYFNEEQQ